MTPACCAYTASYVYTVMTIDLNMTPASCVKAGIAKQYDQIVRSVYTTTDLNHQGLIHQDFHPSHSDAHPTPLVKRIGLLSVSSGSILSLPILAADNQDTTIFLGCWLFLQTQLLG